jgi:hypothetical protein
VSTTGTLVVDDAIVGAAVTSSQSVTISGQAIIGRALTISTGGSLNVSSTGTLTVNANGVVSVAGTSTLSGTTLISGTFNQTSNALSVSGNLTVNGTLTSVKSVTLNSAVTVNGTFSITAGSTLNQGSASTITVNTAGQFNLTGTANLNGNLKLYGNWLQYDYPTNLGCTGEVYIYPTGVYTLDGNNNSDDFHINGALVTVEGFLNIADKQGDLDLVVACGQTPELRVILNYPQTSGGIVSVTDRIRNDGIIYMEGASMCSKRFSGDYPVNYYGTTILPAGGSPICFSNLGPLGISLLSFDAKRLGQQAQITWVTENEENNEHFTLERSQDLRSWITVTTVKGSLYSIGKLEYIVYDESPLPGINYYRLSQTDTDSTKKIFDGNWLRYVVFDDLGSSIYPCPARDHIIINNLEKDNALFEISNMLGHPILSGRLSLGENRLELTGIAPGSYFIRTEWGKIYRILKSQ